MSLKKNKNEIIWNLINSGLAGALVFLGACTSGGLNKESIITGLLAAGIIFLTKFWDYWKGEKSEYSHKIFSFLK